ncbi:nardilysin-like [Saccoglossus kowalevskii]
MAEVVKSPNDSREYRVIELENGLTALLISDIKSASEKCTQDDADDEDDDDDSDLSDESCDSEDEDYMEDSDEDEEGVDGGESDEEGGNPRKSAASKSVKMAAAALCIGVGSFSDPTDIPGLAHFLEHMVFMGSKKYPDENSFDDFIKKHGGNDNASTDCERTVFHFEIPTKHFHEGLDRFAQFFISPLMKPDSSDREIEAVDSEFQMSLTSELSRKQQLLGTFAKDDHPMGKFMWGNTKSLKTTPLEREIDVQERLHEFHARMYSSQYMTLAVQSKESLDTLEEWVRDIFSGIPNNGLPKPVFVDAVKPFVTPKFHKLYKVVPVKNIHQLELTWALPSLLQQYRVKPLHYLSWLIGHEGTGSILSLLKQKCLALQLYCGNDETGFEHNTTHAVFSITVQLTDEGYNNVSEVLSIIFQYIAMLQKVGPQERIYSEIKKIEDNDFRFQEQMDAVDYVESIVENMQLYPKEDYLTGDKLMFEYNAEVISEVTDMLTADTVNILLLSKKHDGHCDEIEPWYQTAFTSENIAEDWKHTWHNQEIDARLHLPSPNKFIATDFTLKDADIDDTVYPTKITDTPHGRLWYKRDTKFKVPKGYIYFHLITPLVNVSPRTLVLFDFFVTILEHNLSEMMYAADVAQLTYHFRTEESGLIMKMLGLNEKLPSSDVRLSVLQHVKWIPVDKQAVVATVTKDEVLSFVKKFKKNLYIEGLVQGNFTSKEALSFFEVLRTKLCCSTIPSTELPETRIMQLPKNVHCCKVRNFNRDDGNSVITNYYQVGPGNIKLSTLIELLVMRMEEPAFDFLRTKEQLGYVVYVMCRVTFGILGFSVTVNTQATKFSVTHVDNRIDSFLEQFAEILDKMTEAEFETCVNSLINLKQREDLHLGEEVLRNWYEITTGTYVFDRLEKEISELKQTNKQELVLLFRNSITGGTDLRKLSTQIVGSGEYEHHNKPVAKMAEADIIAGSKKQKEELNKITKSKQPDTGLEMHVPAVTEILVNGEVAFPEEDKDIYSLNFLPADENYSSPMITDISKFKKDLLVFPVTKLDH